MELRMLSGRSENEDAQVLGTLQRSWPSSDSKHRREKQQCRRELMEDGSLESQNHLRFLDTTSQLRKVGADRVKTGERPIVRVLGASTPDFL